MSALQRTVLALVCFSRRHPRGVLVSSVVLAILSLVLCAARLQFKTDRSDLLCPTKSYTQHWQRYCSLFGNDADIIVVIEGSDPNAMVSAIETVAREIGAYPDHFHKLSYRIRVDALRAKGLYQLPLEDVQRIHDRIESLRPLLVAGFQWLTVENVLQSTRFRTKSLALDRAIDDGNRQAIQSTTRMLESLGAFLEHETVYRSPWKQLFNQPTGRVASIPEYFLSQDGRFGFVRVAPKVDTVSFVGAGQSVTILRDILRRIEPMFPTMQFGLTGLPVLDTDEMEAAQSASTISLLLSVAGVSLLLFLFSRAWKHPLLGIASLLVGACWTMGWVVITIGHLNVLTVSFIITLIGLGIDYSILFLSRYDFELGLGLNAASAIESTAVTTGPSVLVGAVTTALAFFATMFSEFLGLRELGWIAASGILLCMLATFTVLPASLMLITSRKVAPTSAVDDRPFLSAITRYHWTTLSLSVAIAAALAAFIPRLRSDYNLLNLQAASSSSVAWERRILEKTGTSAWYALSIADSADEARQLRTQFESLPTVGRVVEIASLIPGDQPEKQPLIREIHQVLQKLPDDDAAPSFPPIHIQPMIEHLSDLAQTVPMSSSVDRLLMDRLASSASLARAMLHRVDASTFQRRVERFQELWVRDLLDQLGKLRAVSNPEPVTVADLPASLIGRYYESSGKWLLQIFAKSNVWDLAPLKEFHDEIESVDPEATGKPISTLHAMTEMDRGMRRSAWLALAIIIVAVGFDFRNVRDLACAFVPLAFGALCMFGLMGALDLAINPANIIVFPLILGIGIDYGVHVVHDYRLTSGRYFMRWRLTKALLLTCSTTIVGFGALLTASHWGMVSIGIVLSFGIAGCSVGALIVLPSILNFLSRDRVEVADPSKSSSFSEPDEPALAA